MAVTVTMLQTRLGEGGSLWTVGNSYSASDSFAAYLIGSNLATGAMPASTPKNLTAAEVSSLQSLLSGAGGQLTPNVHPNLWCHLYSGNHGPDASTVRDASGNSNDAVRGMALQRRAVWGDPQNRALATATLALKAGTVLARSTTTFVGLAAGVSVSIAAADMPAITGLNLTANQYGVACFYADRSGALSCSVSAAAASATAIIFPETPADKVRLGYVRVTRTSTFTGNTTLLDDTGVTAVFVSDVDPVPAPGYFSTRLSLVEQSGLRDTILHMPSINYDFDGGESMLIILDGKWATPAADGSLIGNAGSSSANGFRIRARTSGFTDFYLYSATGSVASTTGNNQVAVLDGYPHQLAWLVDGSAKTRRSWVDGGTDKTASALATCDTRESAGLHLGGVALSPSSIANTGDFSFRSVTIFRWAATDTLPSDASIVTFLNRLRANPGRTPSAGDLV